MKSLRGLVLDYSKVSYTGVEALRTALPGASIAKLG